VFLVAGCGDKSGIDKVVPVSGKVSCDGAPLPSGMIQFHPDASKGNSSTYVPFGPITDGAYTLQTTGKENATKPGAPPGWYKVTINTRMPPMGTTAPKQMVETDPLYESEKTTPLKVEVVESPGAGQYDFPDVKKKKK